MAAIVGVGLYLVATGSVPSSARETSRSETEIIEYYDDNIFAVGSFTATPDHCDDPFSGGAAELNVNLWRAVSPTSCYQVGAVPITPPLFDCSDGVAPEAPPGRNAIAGSRVVFDVRTVTITMTSHVIDMCIPIG